MVPSWKMLLECLASVSVTLTPAASSVPPLLPACVVVLGEALGREPVAKLDQRDHRAVEALRKLEGVADVVAVAVREGDQVDALRLDCSLSGHFGLPSQGSM